MTMPPSPPVKLYTSPAHPGLWIGEDEHGALVQWPTDGRWAERTPFVGDRRRLVDAKPALARGTKWPGAGRGRKYASVDGSPTKVYAIRVSDSERAEWEWAAGERPVAGWIREVCNEAAAARRRRGR